MEKISVILPSLNVALYIEKCIESVRNQTIRDIEILCVDAGSTDGTLEILYKHEKMDTRIHIIQSEKKSYGYQVNLGIQAASGKYIAIVETDDWIEPTMYEHLFEIAEANNCDYVKADYYYFIEQTDGRCFSEKIEVFKKCPEKYDCIIDPSHENWVYTEDINVWKGIYNKDFLVKNNIWFHETPGAAFQDLGFSMKVFQFAKRAYYVDEAYYQYRIGRDEASIQSPKSVIFLFQEFQQILEEEFCDKDFFYEGIYNRLANAFILEFQKVLKKEKYCMESEYIAPVFEWFVKIFSNALEKGMWPTTTTEPFVCSEVKKALFHTDQFIACIKGQNDCEKRFDMELASFLAKNEKKQIYIFGAGKYGINVYKKVFILGYDILGFIDNSEKLQGELLVNKTIFSANVVKKQAKRKHTIFIVASKYHYRKIKAQLENMGISQSDICVYGGMQ